MRYSNDVDALKNTQVWEDMSLGKKFKLSTTKSCCTKDEIDATGENVSRVYFPNITGVANFKERVALLNSMKFNQKIIPDLKFK